MIKSVFPNFINFDSDYRKMLPLFLLLFGPTVSGKKSETLQQPSVEWKCPNISVSMENENIVHCHCDIPHTLR